MPRKLTPQEVKEVLSLKKEDMTSKKLKDFFAIYMGKDAPRFNTNDRFVLLKNDYFNKENVETTIGRYIFNLVAIPESYLKKYGYCNDVLTAKNIEKLENRMGNMMLDGEMKTTKDYISYLDDGEFLGMNMSYYLLPSMNYAINTPIKEVIQRRDELFNQYAKEIAEGDPNVTEKIEKELLDIAKKKLVEEKNPSYDFFASGEFKFANNYKKTSIMGGAFIHPSTGKIVVSKSNYSDGITMQDYPIFTNLTTAGAYARGVSTQDGGAETKRLNKSLQATCLDVEGSDCGTKMGVRIDLTDKNKEMFKYRYLIDSSGNLVYLTEKNIGKYVGQNVKLRSPLYCKGDKICSKCAGELFYKMGINNAGLLTSTYSGVLMNRSMKTFHDTSIKFSKIDFEKYIKEI